MAIGLPMLMSNLSPPYMTELKYHVPSPRPTPVYSVQADIWALGVTLCELCTLQHPFGGAASQAPLFLTFLNLASDLALTPTPNPNPSPPEPSHAHSHSHNHSHSHGPP